MRKTGLGAMGLAGLAVLTAAAHALAQPAIVNQARVLRLPSASDRNTAPVISTLAISPNGLLVAMAGDDHVVRVVRVADGSIQVTLRGHSDWVRGAAFHPDGIHLLTAGDDRRVRLWNLQTGQQAKTFTKHPAVIYAVAVSDDGQLAATAGFENKIRVYRATTGERLAELDATCADIRALDFAPGGSMLAAGGRDGRIAIYDAAAGVLARQFPAHDRRLRVLQFSADGTQVASAGEGPNIRVSRVSDGSETVAIVHDSGEIRSLVFTDPQHLATGSTQNRVQLWDLASRQEVTRFVGHEGTVATLAMAENRGVLISGGYDTTLRFWNMTGTAPATARKPLARPRSR